MDIQKYLWIFILIFAVARLFYDYFYNRSKWDACPYRLDLWQLILFSSISLSLIGNILALFRLQMTIFCIITMPLLQLINLILCIVDSVLIALTLKYNSECVLCN
jgi:hypothetical protein